MKTATTGKQYSCGLEASLEVISGKWPVLILWGLRNEARRFGEWRRQIPGITEKMLIQHLKEREEGGMSTRKDYREVPPAGEDALPSFVRCLREALPRP